MEDNLQKAIVLMESALRKYKNGDIEGGDSDRNEANRLFDTLANEDAELDTLYGESRNFGVIYSVIEGNTSRLNEDKGKRIAYKDIINTIREDSTLRNQFKIYEALSNTENIKDPQSYVTEAVSLMPSMSRKRVLESNNKLIGKIKKYNLYEMVDIDDDKMDLFESIEYLMLNKKNFSNLSEYENNKSNIVEYIRNHSVDAQVNESVNDYGENAVELMRKYSKDLNEDEIKLIKELSECEDREAYFNDYKTVVMSNLNEMKLKVDNSEKSDIEDIIESLDKKTFNSKTFITDIAEMKEISSLCE